MPLWSLFLLQAALPPKPPAVTAPPPCPTPPQYSYSSWTQTREERQFQGEWVVQYLYYSRTKTDACRGTSSTQSKVEGPFRLYPAVPANRVADVNRPSGTTDGLSGAPLRSSTLPEGGAPGVTGPNPTPTATKSSPAPTSSLPMPFPFFSGFALLVGVLVASFFLWRRRDKVGPIAEHAEEPLEGPAIEPVSARTMDSIKPNTAWMPDSAETAWLQAFFGVEETGYGPLTQGVVAQFQKKHGIPVDAKVMVGPKTYRALWEAHKNLVHEHWEKLATGQSTPELDRVMDSPMPPDLRAEMQKLNDDYAAHWAAAEGRYQAILQRNSSLVTVYEERMEILESLGVKANIPSVLTNKYQPIIDTLYRQAEKVKKDANDGEYAKLLAMLAAADQGKWDEVASAKARLGGRWDALLSSDKTERNTAEQAASFLGRYIASDFGMGGSLVAQSQQQPSDKADKAKLSGAITEAVNEYLSISPAIPYTLGGQGNNWTAAQYQAWIDSHPGETPPGIDCSGYLLQIMKRVSGRLGLPDPGATVSDSKATYLDQKLVDKAVPVKIQDIQPGDLLDWSGEHIMMVTSRTEGPDGTITLGITESSSTAKYGEARGPKQGTFTFPQDADSLADGFLNMPGYGKNSKHLSNNPYQIHRPTYWTGEAPAQSETPSKHSSKSGDFWATVPEEAPDISTLPASLRDFGWNQDKVNAVWDYCIEQKIDPRLVLAIIPQEGTGSFNTSSANKAADGQNGYNPDFSNDLKLAVGHVKGKLAFFGTALDKGFEDLAREHNLSTPGKQGPSFGNVIQFINWSNPMDNHNPPQGYYANHASWCKNVAKYYKDMGGDVDELSKWVAENFSPSKPRDFTLKFVDDDVYVASGWTGAMNVYTVRATGKSAWRNPDNPKDRKEIEEKLASGEWVLKTERTAEAAIISVFQ